MSNSVRITGFLVVALTLSGPGGNAPALADYAEQTQFGARNTIPAAWADLDGDGRLDIIVGNYNQQNHLFVNNGDQTWGEIDAFGAGATFAVCAADFDQDGDLDVAVANGYGQQNKLYINEGNLVFTEESQFGLGRSNAVAWGDVDLDGDLDLAVGNGLLNAAQPNKLYINHGNGSWAEQDQFGIGQSASVDWGDFDLDGDLDLAVGNGGFGHQGQNYLYVNNGDGTFTERAEFGGSDTACVSWGDCDNDGDLDLAVGNWGGDPSQLYINLGDGSFYPAPAFGGRDTNTLAWGDADLDGDLDVAVGNGDFQHADANYLYLNNGNFTFTEVAEFGLGSTDAVAWGDCDQDGDLDMVSGNEHSPPQNYLYINQADGSAYLIVELHGHAWDLGSGYSNRDGVGAKLSVYEAGFLGDPGHLRGYREIVAHGGFASQNQMAAHFGLPGLVTVDLRITWPGSGGTHIVQEMEGVVVGQYLVVEETTTGASVGSAAPPLNAPATFRARPNPFRTTTRIELASASGSLDRLAIYDVRGRIVQSLRLEGRGRDGFYQVDWDGMMYSGLRAPAGVYIAHGEGGNAAAASGRLLVLR